MLNELKAPLISWEEISNFPIVQQPRNNIGRRRVIQGLTAATTMVFLLNNQPTSPVQAVESPYASFFPSSVQNLMQLTAEQLKAYTSPNKSGQKLSSYDPDTGEGSYQIALHEDLVDRLNALPYDEIGLGSWHQVLTDSEINGKVRMDFVSIKEKIIDIKNPPKLSDMPFLPEQFGFRLAVGTDIPHFIITSKAIPADALRQLNLMQFLWSLNQVNNHLTLDSARAFLKDNRFEYPLFPNRPFVPTPGIMPPTR